MVNQVTHRTTGNYQRLGNSNRQHTVKSGDTLSKVARNNEVSLDSLLAANPQITNANAISVGQVIDLPSQTNTAFGSTASPAYTGPGSSPAAGGLPEPTPDPIYTGPGSSPATGRLPEPTPDPIYTGPGSSPATGGQSNSRYTVADGDTLTHIARDHNVGLVELLTANPKISNPNSISVGQVINIPTETTAYENETSDTKSDYVYTGPGSSPGTGGSTRIEYTVVAGDTLSHIARDNNVTLNSLLTANPTISNPNAISVGQVIDIQLHTNTQASGNEIDSKQAESDYVYTGPGSSPGTGGLPEPSQAPTAEYTGPGSSPGTGGLPEPGPAATPIYTGPGSSPGTGGLPPVQHPPYTGPGSSPAAGGLTAADKARQLRNDLPEQQPVDAEDLLATGNYDNHFTRGTDLDLRHAERSANEFNGGENHIVTQSVFDPVVSHKNTTVDEYSVTAVLPDGVDPRELLERMATDMDQTLGGEFAELGNFKNQGETPEVGQIIDIDVEDGPRVPLVDWQVPFAESPFNAPVIISHIDDNSFSVQTIEYNNQEHLLHGTREWGFEENTDGSVTFYTRGVSVEDIKAAEGLPLVGGAKEGEFRYWSAWTDGVERELIKDGAGIVDKQTIQTNGPTGEELWQNLDRDQKIAIKDSQIASHEREVVRLEDDMDNLSNGDKVKNWLGDFIDNALPVDLPLDALSDPLELAEQHQREADGWRQVDV